MEAEMKPIHNPGGRNEDFGKLVIVNDSFSEENIHVSKEWYCLENENFIDLQGNSRCIPERFCTNKQVYSENGSALKSIQEDEVLMDEKETEIVPELNQIKKYLQTYKEHAKFLQNINEKLMTANKRLWEYLEKKETDYEKWLLTSKDILKEKRAIQKQYEHMKTQSKEAQNRMEKKDVEYARLQKRSQVLSDLTVIAEASKSL